MPTLKVAMESFLSNIQKSKYTTWKVYRSDLLGATGFLRSLAPDVKPVADISVLTETMGAEYMQSLLDAGYSVATRQRRASVVKEFFRFAEDEYNIPISAEKLTHRIKNRHLLSGNKEKVEFNERGIVRILEFSRKMEVVNGDLRMRRDVAFIWTLAETGLRVSEACALKIGQIDPRWRATLIGKGDKQGTVRFGKISRTLISNYLKTRAGLDATTGFTRELLPLFARHDQTSGKRIVKPISPKAGEEIVHRMAHLALGDDYDPYITCHKFRHYFVTIVLRETGGDLKAAQDQARHANVSVTTRYVHRDSEENAEIHKKIFG